MLDLGTIAAAQRLASPLDRDPPAVFVIETAADAGRVAVGAALRWALREAHFSLVPALEGATGPASRFWLLTLPGLPFAALPGGPFELAYALLDALALRSVEPLLDAVLPGGESPAVRNELAPDDLEWHLAALRAPAAWRYSESLGKTARGLGVAVAQPDTGTAAHRLLRGAVDESRGRNYVEPGCWPIDPLAEHGPLLFAGHGTATASVAVARAQGAGPAVRGVAPAATLVPYRVTNGTCAATFAHVAAAIDAAQRAGCEVISLSIDCLLRHRLIEVTIQSAVDAGAVVVAVAGEHGRSVTYPGRDASCVTVAATTVADLPWNGSCRGPAVSVAAPGALVFVAARARPNDQQNQVRLASGTAFAAAAVAGAAALWLAHHGRADLIRLVGRGRLHHAFAETLRRSARRPAGWDAAAWGAGIADAEALLRSPIALPPADVTAPAASAAEADAVGAALAELEPGRTADAALVERYGNEILFLAAQPAGFPPSPSLTAVLTCTAGDRVC